MKRREFLAACAAAGFFTNRGHASPFPVKRLVDRAIHERLTASETNAAKP